MFDLRSSASDDTVVGGLAASPSSSFKIDDVLKLDIDASSKDKDQGTPSPQFSLISTASSLQQEHSAPVEETSPLGKSVGSSTIMMLNVGTMIGIGVYSTPSSILLGTGSPGLSLLYWVTGLLITLAHLAVLHEFAAYFPGRSGSEVVFLEQSYPRPRYFFPLVMAFNTVLLGFASSTCIVLAKYLFQAVGHTNPTGWQTKGLAVGAYTGATVMLTCSGKWSYRVSNAIGVVKLATLTFISVAGVVVLAGKAPGVANPGMNLGVGAAFAFGRIVTGATGSGDEDGKTITTGTPPSPYGLSNALVKIIFSYAGAGNAINVATEVRGKRPVRRIRIMEFAALFLVGVLFIMANVAYFAAIPRREMETSNEIAASLFFRHVFGDDSAGARVLDILIVVGAMGSIVSATLGSSRRLRESGRQGVLPFPEFWASTRPWGTPLGPYVAKWLMTTLMIVAPPAGDAFNFIVDLQMYPGAVFELALSVGLILVRWRRARRPDLFPQKPEFRAWTVALAFNLAMNLLVLVLPWYPPDGGPLAGDVSFWYATYAAAGVGVLLACAGFYVLRIHLLPRMGGYRVRHEAVTLEGGEQTNRLMRVPLAELAAWDAAHDEFGRTTVVVAEKKTDSGSGSGSDSGSSSQVGSLVKEAEVAHGVKTVA